MVLGCRVEGLGFGIRDAGFRGYGRGSGDYGSEFRAQGICLTAQSSGFRVIGFRCKALGFRDCVYGLRFRVWG
jgi:hypothetical protein